MQFRPLLYQRSQNIQQKVIPFFRYQSPHRPQQDTPPSVAPKSLPRIVTNKQVSLKVCRIDCSTQCQYGVPQLTL
ncbi:hypothetical protein D3C78_1537950 [compost metagenome]